MIAQEQSSQYAPPASRQFAEAVKGTLRNYLRFLKGLAGVLVIGVELGRWLTGSCLRKGQLHLELI